jgi:hypothetical protein
MRWLLALLAWTLSSAVLAPVLFFAVLVVAGPHSSVLPSVLQPVALLLGWAVLLGVPIWVARKVWRHAGPREHGG